MERALNNSSGTLGRITKLICSSENPFEVFLNMQDSIISLFNADRVTLFVEDDKKGELHSKVKTGAVPKEIRLSVNKQSIAGYVAATGAILSINDVYNERELNAIYPDLKFDQSWDKKTGYRTRQMLAYPLKYNESILGVIQIINKKNSVLITQEDQRNLMEISQVLGAVLHNYQKKMVYLENRFEYLLHQNIISRKNLNKAIAIGTEQKRDVSDILANIYHIDKPTIGKSLTVYYNVKFFEYNDSYTPSSELLSYIKMRNPAKFMVHNAWVPYKIENERIQIVCEDPGDEEKINDIQILMGDNQFEFLVGFRSDILKVIGKLFNNQPVRSEDRYLRKKSPENKAENVLKPKTDVKKAEEKQDLGIIKFVNQIIQDASNKGASDIHIETNPGNENTLIRFRVDGECFPYKKVLPKWKRHLVTRIKIMSNLNIAERRLPQDGKIKITSGGKTMELRVATIPTFDGNEDVVMRILSSQKPVPIGDLNLSPLNKNIFLESIKKPYGIFLVVGPTGSGKTTTLHSALGHINKPNLKIWTAEDPIEITQSGLRQVQIRRDIDLTFATVLRAFLRADPDIIMIGEMRDHETANIGVEASLTGHLVFSTLHTNSAPETVTRLVDLGIDPFNCADALIGVLAQRLIKSLCPKCKEKYEPTREELMDLAREYGTESWPELKKDINEHNPHRPVGCQECNNTGFKGRTAIHEILANNNETKELIQKRSTVTEIQKAAIKNGMRTLKQDGIWKVLKGDTTIEQVRSVCS